jgi:hypothetical protein
MNLVTERQLDYLKSLLAVDADIESYEALTTHLIDNYGHLISTPFNSVEEMTAEDCSKIISEITGTN